jgi:tRNA splicing ligase
MKKYEVAARSYDKFFNLDEVPMTEFESLKETFKYPLVAYIKENGYLGNVTALFPSHLRRNIEWNL